MDDENNLSGGDSTRITKLAEQPEMESAPSDPFFDQWTIIGSFLGIISLGTLLVFFGMKYLDKYCFKKENERIVVPMTPEEILAH